MMKGERRGDKDLELTDHDNTLNDAFLLVHVWHIDIQPMHLEFFVPSHFLRQLLLILADVV